MPSFPPGSPFEEFFKQFDQPGGKKRKAQSLGSGFIIDETGYVITNNHVIDNAEKIMVILYDDTSFEATVVGKDPKTDVALLKIDPKKTKLTAVKFGDSNNLRVGDWVMAIGNPFGLEVPSRQVLFQLEAEIYLDHMMITFKQMRLLTEEIQEALCLI
jgi:serine protease Do